MKKNLKKPNFFKKNTLNLTHEKYKKIKALLNL